MFVLKTASLYFLGFFVSLFLLEQIEGYVSFVESPYNSLLDVLWAAIYFTLFFTLFDQYVLKRLLKK
jgi:hypothetical protein